MNIITKPFRWVSAHREVPFLFEYEHNYLVITVASITGKAIFTFDYDGINSLAVGDYFFIDTGIYKGYHKVTELVTAFQYLTDTDFIGADYAMTMYFIEDHVFTIKAGYDSGDLEDLFSLTQIAEFKPEPNSDGQLAVNISGYINKLFDVINSNDTLEIGSLTVYYNTFRQIQLFIDDTLVSEHIALNSAITMFELNRDYVDTGRALNGGSLGNHYLSCGDSVTQLISDDFVIQGESYSGGVAPSAPAGFLSSDFNASDFETVGG